MCIRDSFKVNSGVSDLRIEICGYVVTKRSGNTSSGTATGSSAFVCVLSVWFVQAWILSLLGVATRNEKFNFQSLTKSLHWFTYLHAALWRILTFAWLQNSWNVKRTFLNVFSFHFYSPTFIVCKNLSNLVPLATVLTLEPYKWTTIYTHILPCLPLYWWIYVKYAPEPGKYKDEQHAETQKRLAH